MAGRCDGRQFLLQHDRAQCRASAEHGQLRLQVLLGDTGLLVSHAFDDKALAAEDIHKRLLLGNLEVNEGMLMENVVAQMLAVSGHPLFFFSKYDKSNAEERMEIDFLIAKSKIGRRKNIIPIEVKSKKRYTTNSLDKFTSKYRAKKVDGPLQKIGLSSD